MYAIDILLTNRSKSNRDNEKIDREIELFWMLKYNHFFFDQNTNTMHL